MRYQASNDDRVSPHSILAAFAAGLIVCSLILPTSAHADPLLPTNDNQSPPYFGVWEGFAGANAQITACGNWLNRKALWANAGPYWGTTDKWIRIEAWVGGLFSEKFWGQWVAAVPGRRTTFCVEMLPDAETGGCTLEKGAKGAYNKHFALMAANLVKWVLGKSIICMGIFNTDVPWKIQNADDAANFAHYWQQIVTTMKAVPGAEHLEFDWVGANAKTTYPIEAAYPGDAYVDYVGMVLFDRCLDKSIYPIPANATDDEKFSRWKKAWELYYYPASANGLQAWLAIAKSHKKPFSIPAWCLDSDHYEDETLSTGGDNTYFIQQMFNFIQDPANHVNFALYEDEAWDCTKLSPFEAYKSSYPKSAALFHQLFAIPAQSPSSQP